MSKITKIIIAVFLILALVFICQKAAHSYIERKANEYLSPYFVSAKLHYPDKVSLKSKFFPHLTLMCKIRIVEKELHIIPLGENLISKLLPDEIKISLF